MTGRIQIRILSQHIFGDETIGRQLLSCHMWNLLVEDLYLLRLWSLYWTVLFELCTIVITIICNNWAFFRSITIQTLDTNITGVFVSHQDQYFGEREWCTPLLAPDDPLLQLSSQRSSGCTVSWSQQQSKARRIMNRRSGHSWRRQLHSRCSQLSSVWLCITIKILRKICSAM